jgi:membrane fusion protein, copper/silver efflux system
MKDRLRSNEQLTVNNGQMANGNKKRLFLFVLLLTFFSCNEKIKENADMHKGHEMNHVLKADSTKDEIYWCPMDTQVVQKGPGICPICNMHLEPKPMPHNDDSMNSHAERVYTPANVAVLSAVRSVKPVLKIIPVRIKAAGYITYDERRIYNISARIGGRIEKLHIKYNYQPIQKGQALFEIYSHELQAAQQEYLFLKKNDPNATDLINSSKRKLLLLGMSESQINRIKESDHVHATTTVYSSYSGFVVETKDQREPFTSGSLDPMNSPGMKSNSMPESSKELFLREGAYVDKGQNIFRVANTDVVWGVLEIYSSQLPQVKLNQTVHVRQAGSDEMIIGKINFIEASYKEGSGTVRLRVYLDNRKQDLKIGNLLSAEIEAGNKQGLMIPQTAFYDLGRDKIVFVKHNGAFQTRKVLIGYSGENEVEVLSGLTEGEEIAENAQFMIDSESFIKLKD